MNRFARHTSVRTLSFCFLLLLSVPVVAQSTKLKNKKYQGLLWEITKKGTAKPSYLFGTMHVSNKMVFHLSDSFYLGLKQADVVALETNPGEWQENFSRYNMEGPGYNYRSRGGDKEPSDYLSLNTFRALPYEKLIEIALSSQPSMINNFLYRNNSYRSAEFEEDTYLDLYIYQVGRKWNKKLAGVENFDESMRLMKEAYADAAKDKKARQRNYNSDADFSYAKLEDAYRTGNLDLLDTIHKVNSRSDAFDEKFLYRRNDIQAANIDSIIRSGASLFVGVGAAHLPGERGVIELLRRMGYRLRPIRMTERDSRHKDAIEALRVPVRFSKTDAPDGLFSVNLPGPFYSFSQTYGLISQQQYADMSNGSYYMVTRVPTFAGLWSQDEKVVLRKLDSVLYENIPGKMLSKKAIARNGYNGFDIVNRTRRGDVQRYNIFVTPFELLVFKMSGNGEYVSGGTEGNQFFNSIQLKPFRGEWKKYTPTFGGFSVTMPEPFVLRHLNNWKFSGIDKPSGTHFMVQRTDVHNLNFVEEDSFDLNLMEESFAASEFIQRPLYRQFLKVNGYPALDMQYRLKDSGFAQARFIIQGPHYYLLLANGKKLDPKMAAFFQSFNIQPFVYGEAKKHEDTSLHFRVTSPVPLRKPSKLDMYPEEAYGFGRMGVEDEEAELIESGTYRDLLVEDDSTGEKVYVSYYKPGRYDSIDTTLYKDSSHFKDGGFVWKVLDRKRSWSANGARVQEMRSGDSSSSRMVISRSFRKDGTVYTIRAYTDTLTRTSAFYESFFASFAPPDTLKGAGMNQKASIVFFSDFFSSDTTLRKRAVKNIDQVTFDSSNFAELKRAIQSLTWKEKKYLDVKTSLISHLSNLENAAASDFLRELYYAAQDTIDLQYVALESLLNQKTRYSYQVFKNIMLDEPPVLQVGSVSRVGGSRRGFQSPRVFRDLHISTTVAVDDIRGSFDILSALSDSLQLTQTIFTDLLPLINLEDYKPSMMELLKSLVDSNRIAAKDYESYLPKFLMEAKQEMKKQVIKEKSKSIVRAQQTEEEKEDNDDQDFGNGNLLSYASLLMPFWDQNAGVKQLVYQMLHSSDKRLRYNTLLLLLEKDKPVPDSLLRHFAAMDEYRYELYMDLRKLRKLNLFPKEFNHHQALARSEFFATKDGTDDSLVFIDRLPAQVKGQSGYVYFFRHRNKKDNGAWKLAMVGLVPKNEGLYLFDLEGTYEYEPELDLTHISDTKLDLEEPLQEQLWKALKKKLYSKRLSAADFYDTDDFSPANMIFRIRD